MSTAKPRTRATPKVASRIPRNGGTADKENKNTKALGPANAGKMDEELEKKFNIEGLNTIDIVYARQENDVARGA
jgi:hypothetical protein